MGGKDPGPPPCVARPALFVAAGTREHECVELAVEEPLEIRINGVPYAVVMRTPGHEMELAAGFCLTEGLVDAFSELLSIGFCADAGEDARNVVNAITARGADGGLSPRLLPSRTSCGLCGIRMIEDVHRKTVPLGPGPAFSTEEIAELQFLMSERQELSRRTTGTHAVALARAGGELLVVREDVGRHNALDKAIGYTLLRGVERRDCVVLLSGRISFEMVQKAARAQIPLVAAVSAATSLAVELAERLNCTLIGRLRGRSMVIYTHPVRVRIPGTMTRTVGVCERPPDSGSPGQRVGFFGRGT